MKSLQDVLIIAWLKSYPDLRRQPLLIVLIIIISALPLFFMIIFGSQDILSYGILGALVGTLAFMGINAPLQELSWDRYIKMREMMVATPITPIAYSTGTALAAMIISVPGILFYLILAQLLGLLSLSSILWVTLALILSWTTMSTMGFAISTYMTKSNPQTLNNIANILGIALVFLPPVYYPEARLGAWSWLSAVIPSSNAASLIRFYTGISTLTAEDLMLRWGALVVMTLLFVLLVAVKTRWRER